MNETPSPFLVSFRKICFIVLGLGLGLLALMMFLPNAATTIWQIRWYPLHLSSIIFICLGSFGYVFEWKKRNTFTSPGLLFLLVLIPLGLIASAFTGPFPERALIYSFSTLAAIFCGAMLLGYLQEEDLRRFFYSKIFQVLLVTFICSWSSISLYRYLTQQLLPFLEKVQQLDQAANGDLYDLIFQKHFSTLAMRNGRPFGHPNYNSGFLLILLPLLYYGILSPAGKGLRTFSLIALSLGIAVLISTQSRNALLGLGVAVGMAVWWNQLQRTRALQIMGGLATIGLGVLWMVPRFQQMLTSVSPARRGMWQAAWMSGKRYFPFGSGEGLTPEMLQLFSPQLSSIWENSIQFHHTWLHLWAVGGLVSGLGILGITLWILIRFLFPGEIDAKARQLVTPSVMALSASFIVFWADYQLDIFPIALLLYGHLVVLAVCTGKKVPLSSRVQYFSKGLLIVPGICLLICAMILPASIKSRNEIEQAGRAYEQGDIPTAVAKYLEAFDEIPEPYSLNMAAVLLSSDSAGHQKAIDLFAQSLEIWEPQTLVHEYLVDLWMKEAAGNLDENKKQAALEKALHHAHRRAEIAPQLRGSYLDIAQISYQLHLPDSAVTDALFNELLMQGDLLFPGTWAALGDLSVYETAVLQRLAEIENVANPLIQVRVELWQGVLNAAGRYPTSETLTEAATDRFEKILTRPGELQLLQAVVNAQTGDQPAAMRRLLVYMFEAKVSEGMVNAFLQPIQGQKSEVAMSTLLCIGEGRLQATRFQGVGLSARHSFSIPVIRPRSYPDVFGSRLIPGSGQKIFQLTNVE